QRREVNAYRREVLGRDLVSRRVGDKTKTGVFLGSYARNPATGEAIPIWIADYVLMEYGTGAIMAVPAHDTRDFEFATQFKLPIRAVGRTGGGGRLPSVTEDGVLVDSGAFDGLSAIDEHPVLRHARQRLPPTGTHDLADGELELGRELEVAGVVGRHGHDRPGAVFHEHVVRDPDGDRLARGRIAGVGAEEHAGLGLVTDAAGHE